MERNYSQKLRSEVDVAVLDAVVSHGTVNVPHIAEILRVRNIDENVAREDVERLVIQRAQTMGAAMAFSSEIADLSLGIAGR